MATRTRNGVTYTILNKFTINNLSSLPQDVPHTFVYIDPKRTKYDNYVVTVKNEDTDEESCYDMPEYIALH